MRLAQIALLSALLVATWATGSPDEVLAQESSNLQQDGTTTWDPTAASTDTQTLTSGHAAQTARSRFKVAELFKFTKFKQMFHKSYRSLLEETTRLHYFLARAFHALASALKYKQGRTSYYRAINNLSDRSPAELEAMTNRELLEASSSGGGGELSLIESHHLSRKRRSILGGGGGGGGGQEPTLAGPFKRIKWQEVLMGPASVAPTTQAQQLPDEVTVNHATGGCMFAPRNQGSCGSCYAFATIAYFEWLHCKKNALELVPFSEQFILDCGPGHMRGLAGCGGGSIQSVGEFVLNYGLESRTNFVYKKRQNECPWSSGTPLKSTGYLKVRDMEPTSGVHVSLWEKHLRYAPMLIMMSTHAQPAFKEYGGGVYDGASCHPRQTDHTMLLVGYGREDQRDYWLVRNSYGADWGEGGYMKLAKSASCIHPPVGYILGSRDGGHKLEARPVRNKAHDKAPLQRRYSDQLASAMKTWKI